MTNYPQQPYPQQPHPQQPGPGQHGYPPQPGYHQPAAPRKRRVWPWIVGGIVMLIIVIAAANGGDPGPTAGGPAAPAESGAEKAPSNEVPFGTPYRWRNEEIVISAPREHVEHNQFLQPAAGNRYIAFDVTVRNISDTDRDVASTQITVVHAGRAAQEAFMAGSQAFPQGRIPPGGSVTYTQVYEIGDTPGELRVSVLPTLFSGDTAYFVGQV